MGLAQGSVISATLFINDIKVNLNRRKINLFADDTPIYLVGEDANAMIEVMNQGLEKLCSWLNVNKLKLNANKTKYMVLDHAKSRGGSGSINCEIKRTYE